MRTIVVVSVLLRTALVWAAVIAGASAVARAAEPILDIDNRVPKFEAFYAKATSSPLDEASRWALWQRDYGIAAVPPGSAGQAIARKLLDSAWPRYARLVPTLEVLSARATEEARALFKRDAQLLGADSDPIHSRIVLYVGQFDDNAFTVPPMGGKPPTVVMPVENSALTLALAHELAHTIHMQLVHVTNGFGAPVGETLFLEGIAMRTAQQAVPGLPDADYTEMVGDPGWYRRCQAGQKAILASILPDLDRSGADVAMKYTFGRGNTGLHREVYCAAWIVTGRLLASGRSLPELARIDESRMVTTIRAELSSPDGSGRL
jgi:hypothetical protein